MGVRDNSQKNIIEFPNRNTTELIQQLLFTYHNNRLKFF